MVEPVGVEPTSSPYLIDGTTRLGHCFSKQSETSQFPYFIVVRFTEN
jgi:hypothetical protein